MWLGSISDVSVPPSVVVSSCVTVGVPCSQRSEKLGQLHRDFAGEVEVLDYWAFLLQRWRQKQFGPCFLAVVVGTGDFLNLCLWSFLPVAGLSLKFSVPTGSVFKRELLARKLCF